MSAKMSFSTHPIIGHPTQTTWSQFWENQSQDSDFSKERGRLFGLITIQKENSDQEISVVGKELISFFNETYFKGSESSCYDQLKKTLEKVGEEHPVFVEGNLKTSLAVAVYYKNFIYLGTYGDPTIKVLRDQRIITLISPDKSPLQVISGIPEITDRYFFLSSAFLSVFQENLDDEFKDPDPDRLKESLSSKIYSQKDSSDLALVVLDLKSSPEKESNDFTDPSPDQMAPPTSETRSSSEKKPKLSFPKLSFLNKKRQSIKVHDYPIPELDRRRKISAIIAIGFLILLSTSIYFGNQKRQATIAQEKYDDLSQQVKDRLSTAQTLKNLNLEDALAITKEAQTIFLDLEALSLHPEEVSSLKTALNTLLAQTGQEGTFSPDLFYDLALIRSGIQAQSISLEGSTLYLLDPESHRIDQLDTSKKSTKLTSDNQELKNALNITASNNTVYILSKNNISKVTSTSLDSLTQEEDWEEPLDIASWEGKVYILTKDMIYKYPLTASGLGSRQEWLKKNLTISTPVSLAINGKIWVLSKSGKVQPYFLGQEDKYDQSSIANIKDAKYLTTHPDLDIVIFTDQQKDIYLFDKEGKSIAKYSTNLTILDLALDPQNNKIFILANDQKLYQINLN